MSRIRLMLLGILAMLAVGAVTSSTASAAELEVCGSGTVVALCFPEEGVLHEAPKGLYPFDAKIDAGTEGLLEIAPINLHIVCTAENATGEFNQPAELTADVKAEKAVIDYHGCTVLAPLECEVGLATELGLLKTESLTAEPNLTEPDEWTFSPPSGKPFIALRLSGANCTQSGTFNVTGTQVAKWDNLNDALTHLLTAGPTSKHLPAGKAVTEFLNEVTAELLPLQEFDFDLV
jgi:hypothetical protein